MWSRRCHIGPVVRVPPSTRKVSPPELREERSPSTSAFPVDPAQAQTIPPRLIPPRTRRARAQDVFQIGVSVFVTGSRASAGLRGGVVRFPRRCVKPARRRFGILATIRIGLSNAGLEAVNNKTRTTITIGYGHRSPNNLISPVMPECGGLNPTHPGHQQPVRTTNNPHPHKHPKSPKKERKRRD